MTNDENKGGGNNAENMTTSHVSRKDIISSPFVQMLFSL